MLAIMIAPVNAFGLGNYADIDDFGTSNNYAQQLQNLLTHYNHAYTYFGTDTSDNTAVIDQSGTGHYRTADQYIVNPGTAQNDLSIIQVGNYHTAFQLVSGKLNDMDIDQSNKQNTATQIIYEGDDNILDISQSGEQDVAVQIINMYCNENKEVINQSGGSNNVAYQVISGILNDLDIDQDTTVDTSAGQAINGNRNEADIDQTNVSNNMAGQSVVGNNNKVDIDQMNGSNNVAYQNIEGNQNTVYTDQDGSNNTAVVGIEGEENYVKQIQIGNENVSSITLLNGNPPAGGPINSNEVHHTQTGNLNTGVILMSGSDLNTVDFVQDGNFNIGGITVTNSDLCDVDLAQVGHENRGLVNVSNCIDCTVRLTQTGTRLAFALSAANGITDSFIVDQVSP
jgi:hypothetical protein